MATEMIKLPTAPPSAGALLGGQLVGIVPSTTIAVSGTPFNLSLTLATVSFAVIPNEDVHYEYFFEGLGSNPAGEFETGVLSEPNQPVGGDGSLANVVSQLTITTPVNDAANPIPPGLYRVGVVVRTLEVGTPNVILTGFIEGSVIQITAA